ncbi:MAG: transaldolase [Lentimicrobiaceae bacterium]|nr:transaldolase [Lentimicrobiaceae bacterium]
MNLNTKKLHDKGVSLWMDNISREMIDDKVLERYINEYFITGLTSNPSIFDKAIGQTDYYDSAIAKLNKPGLTDEELFFELAIEDIQRAADLFLPVFKHTNGLDGFVSIEVSPLLAYDTESTIKSVSEIHQKVNRPNAFVKIPGTPEGIPAIEASIADGIPVNVTLLFSAEQYEAASLAYLRGIETRINKGLNADVRSVASLFVSRWDKAVEDKAHPQLKNKLGIAIAQKTYESYLGFLQSARVQRIMNFGASPQRLLWASTGTKDPDASDILYVKNLIAPFTINTIPDKTLMAFADHGEADVSMPAYSEEADRIIREYANISVDHNQLAEQLQNEGAEAFNKSWNNLISSISNKRNKL